MPDLEWLDTCFESIAGQTQERQSFVAVVASGCSKDADQSGKSVSCADGSDGSAVSATVAGCNGLDRCLDSQGADRDRRVEGVAPVALPHMSSSSCGYALPCVLSHTAQPEAWRGLRRVD